MYFEYSINFIDDEELKAICRHGVTFAESFQAAAEHIQEFYGENFLTLKIAPMDSADVYEFEGNSGEKAYCGGKLFIFNVKDRD